MNAIGIPIALIGAIFLSLGAQFQHRGVTKVEAQQHGNRTLGMRQILALLSRPSWVAGILMTAVAVVLQLTSLRFAALVVVQPIGAVALVITTLLNARVTHTRPTRRSIRAIVLCVGGVGLFVIAAALTTGNPPAITDDKLIVILILLAAVLILLGGLFIKFRSRMTPITYILGAGVQFGFVATLAKTVIQGLTEGRFDVLSVLAIVGLLAAGAGGGYFVQTAYSVGPPDLVIAGLTVVDPLVAVGIGLVVLQEAAGAPAWAPFAYIGSGIIAVIGVFQLARYHPQSQH